MRFVKYLIILFLLLCSTTVFSQRFVRDDAGQIWFIDSTSADTVKIDVTGAVFKIVNTGATFEMTSMTTAQRDALTASNGMIINNSSVNQIQGYANGSWVNLGAGAGGGISNVIEDLSPQLGGDLDANAFDIQFDDADGIHDSNDNEQLIFQLTASAVNFIEITNAATGNEPLVSAAGSDTDVSLTLDGQGAGVVQLLSSNFAINDAYFDIGDISAPSNPSSGTRRIFLNSASGELSVRTSGGSTVSLEAGSSTAWDAIGDPSGDGDVAMAELDQDLSWNTAATAAVFDGLTINLTNDATSDAARQVALLINRPASSGTATVEALLEINNEDTDGAVTAGIEIVSAAGVITNALLLSDSDIVNWADIGANDLITSTATIASDEIDRLDGLAGIIVTDITSITNVDGTNLSISAGTLNVDDAFLVNDAADEMLLADATTNVVTDILVLSHTGGTVAAGFGTGIRFDLEDAGGIEQQASIHVSLDVVTDAAEEVSIIFRHNVAGTIQESMRIDGTAGNVGIGTSAPVHTLEVQGHVGIIRTATVDDEHALEIVADAAGFGDFNAFTISYDTGNLSSGEVAAVGLIDINEIDASGGDVIGLEILSTDGGADNIVGIKIGAEIAPLIQDSGSFINPTLATNNTNTTDVPDMRDGSTGTNTTIFASDNDFIIIGANAANTEIEVVIETGFGGPGIQPVFAFSTTGTNQFSNFTPTDGSNGFKNSGAFVIAWDADEVPGYVADDVTGEFDIRITRTANPAGSVSLFYVKTVATRTFTIDKSGNVRFLTYAFEGATDDAFEHTLNVIDPTADRLLNFPNDQLVAGDVLVASDASDLEYLNLATTEILIGDGSGIPTAAALSGDATMTNAGAVTVATLTITDNESTAETNAIVFVAGADLDGGTGLGLESDGDLTYTPNTGTLTATEFVGGGVGITGVTASHAGTITWTGTSILETGVAFQFGDASDATLTHTYANTGTNVSIAYSTAAMAITGALTATSFGGITEANLVDKSASETMTGNWIFNSNLSIGNAATSSGVLTILEDTDDGTNFASFQVPALAANTAYILPPAFGSSGQQLTDAAGDGVLSWAAVGSGTGAFSDAGDPVVLNTTTKNVEIGDTGVSLDAKVQIAGDADEVQLIIEGHSTQTDDIFIIQQDDETQVFTVSNSGVVTMATDLAVTEGGTGVSALDDILGTTDEITVANGANTIIGGDVTLTLPDVFEEVMIPAGYFNPAAGDLTGATALADDADNTNDFTLDQLEFSASAENYVSALIKMPPDWDGSTDPTFRVFYYTETGSANDVDWTINTGYIRPGTDTWVAALGTADSILHSPTTTDIIYDSGLIDPTAGGTAAAGAFIKIRLWRDGNDANDDHTATARFLYLVMGYLKTTYGDETAF